MAMSGRVPWWVMFAGLGVLLVMAVAVMLYGAGRLG